MSYQVLARKWRPRTFAELVGQEHVVRALSHALETGRTHHAYLFTGTRGVGKTTIARIFAKALDCEHGPGAEPCGQCSVCTAIDGGRFVDLLEIDAASNTSVDDVRQMIENAQYAPTQGRFKIYLIDEVHMLSTSAFNALLKTLEEPPPHVKFLLATTDPQKLPATVLSRCLRFNLKRLLPDQIRAQMEHILAAEQISADGEALEELARAADGSLRDGLSLLDQAIAYGGGKLDAADVRAMLGTVERTHLVGLLDALAQADGKALMAECAHIAEFAPDYAGVLNALATALHRIQLRQLVPDYQDDGPVGVALGELAGRLAPEDVQLYYQLATTGRRDLGIAPDARTGFEMTLLRMLAFQPSPAGSHAAVPKTGHAAAKPARPTASGRGVPASGAATHANPPALHAAQNRPVSPAASDLPAMPPVPRAPAPAVASAVRDGIDWPALIEQAALKGLIHELAVNARMDSLRDGVLTLGLKAEHMPLAIEPMTSQMAEQLSGALGQRIKLHFVTADGAAQTPATRARAKRDARQAAAEQAIDADPVVQSLVHEFDAQVVPGSVRPIPPSEVESHT